MESSEGTFVDESGRAYYSLDVAASLLGLKKGQQIRYRAQKDRRLTVVETAELTRVGPTTRGRPPLYAVPADEVQRERERELRRFHLSPEPKIPDEGELHTLLSLQELEQARADLRTAQTENSRLRERLASMEEALRLSFAIDAGRLDQLQQLLGSELPNE